MGNLAIFFVPEGGYVNRVAKLLASKMDQQKPDLILINEATSADLARYDTIIFGISTIGRDTWDQKFGNIDWAKFMPVVSSFDFSGKKVAVFGLASIHLLFALLKIVGIIIVIALVIGMIGSLINRNK